MRHDSNRSLFIVLSAAALGLYPITAWAEAGGGKKGHEHGTSEGAHGHDHGHGGGAKKDAPMALPEAPAVNKAVTDLTAACPKTTDLRAQIEALAEKRKASTAAIKSAQNESKKQLLMATQAQRKLQIAVKKPGNDSAALLESARVAQEAAVTQTRTIEAETQTLYATEAELGKLAAAADEAAKACADAEETLRTAVGAARKAAQEARKESAKARALARVPSAKALEAQRAAHAKQLETMKKSNDEAKGAWDALKAVAASAPAAAPAAPAAPATKVK